jgi:hypothetical protein
MAEGEYFMTLSTVIPDHATGICRDLKNPVIQLKLYASSFVTLAAVVASAGSTRPSWRQTGEITCISIPALSIFLSLPSPIND